jgi:hypothetical protein
MVSNNESVNQQELEDSSTNTSQRSARGWLVVCVIVRAGFFGMLLSTDSVVLDMQPVSHGKTVQMMILMVLEALSFLSGLWMLGRRRSAASLHPQIQWTTLFTLLVLGITFACAVIGSRQVQTAQYLEWLWRSAAAGMVLLPVALLFQPHARHFRAGHAFWIISADACVLGLLLCVHNALVALAVTHLHLIIANVLLARDMGGEIDLADVDHDETWLKHHQGSV